MLLNARNSMTATAATAAVWLAVWTLPTIAAVATDDQLEEVMVSATRYTTSLLKTPVAVTAVTQAELTKEGIVDVRGLSGQIPNLQLGTVNDGSAGVLIAIRGVTSTDFTEIGNPAVGLHVDGIYAPRPQAALGLLFDLDRLEILRGPQGTLFGRNSTGGSINILAAKPEFDKRTVKAELELGNYNHRQMTGVVNIPVTNHFALRGTFMKLLRNGYINQSQDFYAANFPDLRIPVDATHFPDTPITPALDGNGNPIPSVDQRLNRKVSARDYYTNVNEYAGRIQSLWKINDRLQWRMTYERYKNDGAGDLPLKDCKQAAGTEYACPGGQWDVKINIPGVLDMTIDSVRSNLVWNITPSTLLEYNASWSRERRREIQDSDSGYQPTHDDVANNLGGAPFNDLATYTLGSQYVAHVHELQLRGEFQTWRYVAGFFFMHENSAIDYGQDALGAGYAPYGYPAEAFFYHQTDRQTDSKALFAQVDWQFAPTWNLTLGGRFTHDTRLDIHGLYWDTAFSDNPAIYFKGLFDPAVAGRPYNSTDLLPGMGSYYGAAGFDPSIAPVVTNNGDKWNKLTWRLGLNRQLTPTDMVYGSIATGYKAGGFDDLQDICASGKNDTCLGYPPGPRYTNNPWKPETLTNFEVGYKGELWDRRLTLSVTAFYSLYKDIQLTGAINLGKVVPKVDCTPANPFCDVVIKYGTANAAEAHITGLEIEGEVKPWHGGHIGYSLSHLHAVISSYPTYSEDTSISCNIREKFNAAPCVPYTGTDPVFIGHTPLNIVGNRLPYAPDNTLSLSLSQDFARPSGYTLTPAVQARWQDKMYFTLRNLDNPHISDAQQAYTTLDATLTLTPSGHKWHAEAYVKNWANTIAKNYATVVEPGYVLASYNDPRMYGIRVGAEW